MLIDLPSPAGQQHTRRNRRALARSLEVRPTFEVTWEDIEYLPGLLPRVYQPRGQGSFRAVLEAGGQGLVGGSVAREEPHSGDFSG
jgi:hypothetical protein